MVSASIRPLAVSDAVVLAVLHNRLWRLTYAGLLPDEVLAARDDEVNIAVWRERARIHEMAGTSPEGARTLVAHDPAGQPIGWASIGPPRDAKPPTDEELWSLYVAPEHHGRGVAQALLAAILPSSTAVHLWVVQGNDRAIGFYRTSGFVPDGARTRDERLGADEVRMVRSA